MVDHFRKLTGNETPRSPDLGLADATVLDFWRWAFSDLCLNNVRGVFAEWLVAKLLGIELQASRDSWAASDLQTPDGVRIEVKCSAYIQSWEQPHGSSRIVFTGLKGRSWNPETGYSQEPTYNADLYVFCIQIEKEKSKWNALDLNQWRFCLLSRDELVRLNNKTLSLTTLAKTTPEMTAQEFRKAATDLLRNLAVSKSQLL
ncbi:MAG TPA: hypothetical protein PLZ55_03870 [bacterium]|nr:hypothetical protein [bacterium]